MAERRKRMNQSHPLSAFWRFVRGLRDPETSGPLIVMYHGLGGTDGLAARDFAQQCDRLAELYTIVPLQVAVRSLGQPRAGSLAAITFDDGYQDFAELAAPILQQRGMHATLFVPAGQIGGHNQWDEGERPHRPILDGAGLRGLSREWVEVGAHGWSHCRMRNLTPEALRRETQGAKQRLEEVLEYEVNLFAYPYGQLDDFDLHAQEAVRSAGFVAACSTHFGRASRQNERFRLRRVGVEPTDSFEVFEAKLRGDFDWVAYKERLGAWIRTLKTRGD